MWVTDVRKISAVNSQIMRQYKALRSRGYEDTRNREAPQTGKSINWSILKGLFEEEFCIFHHQHSSIYLNLTPSYWFQYFQNSHEKIGIESWTEQKHVIWINTKRNEFEHERLPSLLSKSHTFLVLCILPTLGGLRPNHIPSAKSIQLSFRSKRQAARN